MQKKGMVSKRIRDGQIGEWYVIQAMKFGNKPGGTATGSEESKTAGWITKKKVFLVPVRKELFISSTDQMDKADKFSELEKRKTGTFLAGITNILPIIDIKKKKASEKQEDPESSPYSGKSRTKKRPGVVFFKGSRRKSSAKSNNAENKVMESSNNGDLFAAFMTLDKGSQATFFKNWLKTLVKSDTPDSLDVIRQVFTAVISLFCDKDGHLAKYGESWMESWISENLYVSPTQLVKMFVLGSQTEEERLLYKNWLKMIRKVKRRIAMRKKRKAEKDGNHKAKK